MYLYWILDIGYWIFVVEGRGGEFVVIEVGFRKDGVGGLG